MKDLSQPKQRWYWPWTVPALVWLVVASWRPFLLGFYHDDWAILRSTSINAIPKDLAQQVSRPVYGLLLVFFRTVLPFDAVFWHTLLGLLLAASALAIALFSRQLARRITDHRSTAEWSGAMAAATWIAIPWDLGVTAWPTTFAAQISVIGFCAVGHVVISDESLRSKVTRAVPAFLAISLISELFWLSFIPLLLISLAGRHKSATSRQKWREAMVLLSVFCAAQVVLLGLNRILVYVSPATSRSFNAAWLDTIFLSLRLSPNEFDRALAWPLAGWALLDTLLLILIFCAAFHPKRRLVGASLLAIATGAFLSLCLFAVASYRIESIGVFSRTTVVISVWFSLLSAVTIAASEYFGRVIQRLSLGAALLLVLLFSVSSISNLQAWIQSWEFEKKVLRDFPAAELAQRAAPGSFVLIDAERPATYSEGFEAFWDITGALHASFPVLRRNFAPNEDRQFAAMANLSKFQTTWDGTRLVQSWCTSPQASLWELEAPSDLYLWRLSGQELTQLTPPVVVGCERK